MLLSPLDMFRSQVDLYSLFDEEGLPTHDAAGDLRKRMKTRIRIRIRTHFILSLKWFIYTLVFGVILLV